jgi:hypothetical protein
LEDGKVVSVIYPRRHRNGVKAKWYYQTYKDPQKLGSAITYYRRYTLQSLLGLHNRDDSGNKTSAPVKLMFQD